MALADFFDANMFMEAAITLVVIMDPPGTILAFLSLVGRKPPTVRARAARQAGLVSLLVISLFAISGQAILAYLGIGIPALQGAGGLLLLLIALDLLAGKGESQPEVADDVNVALVPLGTPLLAGPGAIVATIVFVREAAGRPGAYVALALAIVAVHLVIYLCMRYSGLVIRLIRESGITLLAKIAGLLLAAIAVELVTNSVRGFIAGG
ncbi:MAG TPA: MarC family protein [Amycolatopsis sp.]|uniref:MarC family protein n=1 Tax=Amycolatopsis sp. TaxID=37632 RepID=UPI002B4600E8|nr:MarC family protein [Amycolatopsis sp.]HKS44254.1 MarC family protein [Amycolatopsis sp.]